MDFLCVSWSLFFPDWTDKFQDFLSSEIILRTSVFLSYSANSVCIFCILTFIFYCIVQKSSRLALMTDRLISNFFKNNAASQCWNLIKIFEKCFWRKLFLILEKHRQFYSHFLWTHKNNMLWILEKDWRQNKHAAKHDCLWGYYIKTMISEASVFLLLRIFPIPS